MRHMKSHTGVILETVVSRDGRKTYVVELSSTRSSSRLILCSRYSSLLLQAPLVGDEVKMDVFSSKEMLRPVIMKILSHKEETMTKPEKLLGEVTWAPNRMACSVRVNISQVSGIPLAIKAGFSGYRWQDIKKGDWVEVERTNPKDARRFRVIRLLKEVSPKEPINVTLDVKVSIADDFKKGQEMMTPYRSMSKDRVRFWIDHRYFQQRGMYDVLKKVFNLDENRARAAQTGPYEGFWIVCRPSQFARFMIYRNEAGIKNGFMDLKAVLFTPETPDYYTQLAHTLDIPRDKVKKMIKALGYGHDWLKDRMGHNEVKEPTEIDVS